MPVDLSSWYLILSCGYFNVLVLTLRYSLHLCNCSRKFRTGVQSVSGTLGRHFLSGSGHSGSPVTWCSRLHRCQSSANAQPFCVYMRQATQISPEVVSWLGYNKEMMEEDGSNCSDHFPWCTFAPIRSSSLFWVLVSCQLGLRDMHTDYRQELIRRWDTRMWRDVSSYLFTYLPLNYDTPVVPEYFSK